jgi:tetratricopeptide (TPR) repeat protein
MSARRSPSDLIGTGVRAAVGLLGATLLAGCASNQRASSSQPEVTYTMQSASEAAFELGEDRPPTPRTLHALARIFTAQGRDAEAAAIYERLMKRFPTMRVVFLEMAEMRMRQGATKDAIDVLTEGIAASPDDAILLNNRGMCWLMEENYENALADFTAAAERVPDEPRYTSNRAMALGMAGRYDEALEVYQEVVLPARAHYNLAVICEARNDTERAEVEYAIAMELDPKIRRQKPSA